LPDRLSDPPDDPSRRGQGLDYDARGQLGRVAAHGRTGDLGRLHIEHKAELGMGNARGDLIIANVNSIAAMLCN
jgi:hypothetical protein